MLPYEIEELIIKYHSSQNELTTINKAIDDIAYQLMSINKIIANRLNVSTNNLTINDEEDQLLKDSKILRNYIASIQRLSYDKEYTIGTVREKINLYLFNDEVCPVYNWKLSDTLTTYFDNSLSEGEYKNIITYKCHNCNRDYVLNEDIKEIKLENTNISLNRDYYINTKLTFNDVIVLKTVASCMHKGHSVTDVIVQVPIINNEASFNFISVNVAYCYQCNGYIMLKSEFDLIGGIVACQVIDQTVPVKVSNDIDSLELQQKQSILYQYGYNVKAKDNLSDRQRHIILAMVVESGIMSRGEICSHLDTLIERGSKIEKWKSATEKWKQDRYYIKQYKAENLPSIVTDRIILKYNVPSTNKT